MPEKPHGPPAPADIKKTINRYYDDCMASSTAKGKDNPKEYCARVAWQRFCMNKNPDHPSCTKYGKTRATMEAEEPFSHLFEMLKPDGEVTRDEFDTLPDEVVLEPEDRAQLESFVISKLRPHEIFATAKGQTGIVYHDKRGRATSAVLDEMDAGELRWLAKRLGHNNEMEPEPPPPQPRVENDVEADMRSILDSFYS